MTIGSSTTTTPLAAPTMGRYRIDRGRSTVSFTIRHLFGLGAVQGWFELTQGEIRVADPPEDSSVAATIATASFHTDNAARDAAVRSPRYLAAEAYPSLTFASTILNRTYGGWVVDGELSVRGTARPLVVQVDKVEARGDVLRASACARVDRYDFGVTNAKLLAGRYVDVRLDVFAARI